MSVRRQSADHALIRRARQLRRDLTAPERLIWYALRDRRLAGWKFPRQVVIGPYIVDFVAVHRCCCGYPRHSQGKEPCAKSRKRLLWRLITVIPLTARLNGFGRESAAMTPRLFRPRVGVG